ncbi:MAG: Lrp/AsnC ligand binding domain-containing protein [Candidatus Bathyarchaeota archaeon]|nr:Lrp/AsnC ligand binding domain-containing protein [Candidatus Bathyarchaeota archaeon]
MGSSVVAYLLVITEVGKEHEVVKELSKIEGVSEAREVYGEFDIVCIVEGKELGSINKFVTKIRRTKGILRTVTLISSE